LKTRAAQATVSVHRAVLRLPVGVADIHGAVKARLWARQRVSVIGGEWQIESATGRGTRVSVHLLK